MAVIGKSLDLDLAPARRTARARLTEFFDRMACRLRALQNRREIGSLEEFSDYQLYDIGLTRADLHASMHEGRFTDPSGYLTEVARERRRPIRRSI
ncbi:MAG TPA: DUF1127 domain-containing protein [Pararhizobium sp.]|nr:DUF1127 domain-containing protein [Pararhizobium sp.]